MNVSHRSSSGVRSSCLPSCGRSSCFVHSLDASCMLMSASPVSLSVSTWLSVAPASASNSLALSVLAKIRLRHSHESVDLLPFIRALHFRFIVLGSASISRTFCTRFLQSLISSFRTIYSISFHHTLCSSPSELVENGEYVFQFLLKFNSFDFVFDSQRTHSFTHSFVRSFLSTIFCPLEASASVFLFIRQPFLRLPKAIERWPLFLPVACQIRGWIGHINP